MPRFERAEQSSALFEHQLILDKEKALVKIEPTQPLPAHTLANNLQANGEIEPLLGREWDMNKGAGHSFSTATICYVPGSPTPEDLKSKKLTIGRYGILGASIS